MKIDNLFHPTIKVSDDFCVITEKINIVDETLDKSVRAGKANHIAFTGDRGSITYQELSEKVSYFGLNCISLGIKRGDRVLIRMWNSIEFVISILGLIKIGSIPVLQNSTASIEDVEYVLSHSDCVAAISLSENSEALRAINEKFNIKLIVARGANDNEINFEKLIEGNSGFYLPNVETNADDPALMCYTSGTTGRPKGIIHAQRWIIGRGNSNAIRIPPKFDDIILASGEWSFISLLGHNVFFTLKNGVTGAILEGKATPEKVLTCISKYRVTILYAVPTIYRMILAIKGIEDIYDTASLRGCNASGEALGVSTLQAWSKRFGIAIWEHYGVSEMQMVLGNSPLLPVKLGSVGVPWGVHAKIVDEKFYEVPINTPGQLVFVEKNNPSLFLGYHKDPKKTSEVLNNGLFLTGDLAKKDEDGYFWILGRSDDCFKSKGVFISPIEIENALMSHPKISEACVIPASDGNEGNLIKAVIVCKDSIDNEVIFIDTLRDFLRKKIAKNKVPNLFKFVDSLPKSANNKVLRRSIT
jgi:acyl-coenzyme A synthetase/AMP-(fatty) acid ligase